MSGHENRAIVGIRGAIQVGENTIDGIESATAELLRTMVERNEVDPRSAIAIWITQTPDLTAAHAAAGARRLGWLDVPLLGAQEIATEGDLPRIVRVLMLVPANVGEPETKHCYLGAAAALRRDLIETGKPR
jgi:chorismate mutase